MTDQQRQQRAAFIREQPLLWLFLVYAVTFLGCAVCIDVLHLVGAGGLSPLAPYLMTIGLALPFWVGLRGWARRVEAGVQREARE